MPLSSAMWCRQPAPGATTSSVRVVLAWEPAQPSAHGPHAAQAACPCTHQQALAGPGKVQAGFGMDFGMSCVHARSSKPQESACPAAARATQQRKGMPRGDRLQAGSWSSFDSSVGSAGTLNFLRQKHCRPGARSFRLKSPRAATTK